MKHIDKNRLRKQFLWIWNMCRQTGFEEGLSIHVNCIAPTLEDIYVFMLIALLFERHKEPLALGAREAWMISKEYILPDIEKIFSIGPVRPPTM